MREEKRGRKRSMKRYEVYQIVDGKLQYVNTTFKEIISDTYGITVNRLSSDVKKGLIKKGYLGIKYRIFEEGKGPDETVAKVRVRFDGMPSHVSGVRTQSGCRFEG